MHGDGEKLLQNSNIINNSSPNTFFPIIYSEYSQGNISKCICYNNKLILFRQWGSSFLTISNCFIFHENNYLTEIGNIIYTNNNFIYTLSYKLNHLSNSNCRNYFLTSNNSKSNLFNLIFNFIFLKLFIYIF